MQLVTQARFTLKQPRPAQSLNARHKSWLHGFVIHERTSQTSMMMTAKIMMTERSFERFLFNAPLLTTFFLSLLEQSQQFKLLAELEEIKCWSLLEVFTTLAAATTQRETSSLARVRIFEVIVGRLQRFKQLLDIYIRLLDSLVSSSPISFGFLF